MPPPRVIDEHAAHHLGGDTEEMRAIFPGDTTLRQQADVRLVDDGRWLQCLAAALAAQVAGGQPPKLALDALHQLRFRIGRALPPPPQQHGHVVSAGCVVHCAVSAASVIRRFANSHSLYLVHGALGGGTRRRVARSKAYASSISRGSLQARPLKLTPYGAGLASNPGGNGGAGAFGTIPNGTMTVG